MEVKKKEEKKGKRPHAHLVQEGSRQGGPLVQRHGDSGGRAVAAEPRPLVGLGAAGQRVELKVAGESHQDLNAAFK